MINYYVLPGAKGANNGSDWANAYQALPHSLVRGARYYLANGRNYSERVFKEAESGRSEITLFCATEADHGTEAGWQADYGRGQGVCFIGGMVFMTGYYRLMGDFKIRRAMK